MGFLAALNGLLQALTELAGLGRDYLSWKKDTEMQELGKLRQENEALKTENANLRARLGAVMVAPTAGKL